MAVFTEHYSLARFGSIRHRRTPLACFRRHKLTSNRRLLVSTGPYFSSWSSLSWYAQTGAKSFGDSAISSFRNSGRPAFKRPARARGQTGAYLFTEKPQSDLEGIRLAQLPRCAYLATRTVGSKCQPCIFASCF